MHATNKKFSALIRISFPFVIALLMLNGLFSGLSDKQTSFVLADLQIDSPQAELTVDCTNGIGNEADLIAKIHEANNELLHPGPDTLILGAACVYTLNTIGDTITNTLNQTGLPAITTTITISGHGATIQRDSMLPENFTNSFRLFYVGQTGNLTLQNLTLRNGVAQGGDGIANGGGAAGMGGAIFNDRGYLELESVAVIDNLARGGGDQFGSGGGGGGMGSSAFYHNGGGPNGGLGGTNGGDGDFGGGGGLGFGAGAVNGGDGGFGGGGGHGGTGNGGDGGFGGGGGEGTLSPGQGGFGGGAALPGVAFSGGGGAGLGGAIFNLAGTVRIINSTFYSNTAQGGKPVIGAGIDGAAFGGAIFNLNGQAEIINSTIANNAVLAGNDATSSPDGGGIYSLGDGELFEDGAKMSPIDSEAHLILINSIVANTLDGYLDCIVNSKDGGVSTSAGTNNLIINNDNCPDTNLVSDDPLLGPLQNNGGASYTLAISSQSPALDSGNNADITLLYDQRGSDYRRISGQAVDIGSYELQQPSLFLEKTMASSQVPIHPGTLVTYTLVLSNAGDADAIDVLINDTLPNYLEGSDLTQLVDLAVGEHVTYTVNATLSNSVPPGEVITNTAVFTYTFGVGQASHVFSVSVDNKTYLPLILNH